MDLRMTTLDITPCYAYCHVAVWPVPSSQWLVTSEGYHNQHAGEDSGWVTGGKYRIVQWRVQGHWG
jgi:hypothetical protein